MTDGNVYEVTFKRTLKVESDSPRGAIAKALGEAQGPDDFTMDEVDHVDQLVPTAPLRVTIERSKW